MFGRHKKKEKDKGKNKEKETGKTETSKTEGELLAEEFKSLRPGEIAYLRFYEKLFNLPDYWQRIEAVAKKSHDDEFPGLFAQYLALQQQPITKEKWNVFPLETFYNMISSFTFGVTTKLLRELDAAIKAQEGDNVDLNAIKVSTSEANKPKELSGKEVLERAMTEMLQVFSFNHSKEIFNALNPPRAAEADVATSSATKPKKR